MKKRLKIKILLYLIYVTTAYDMKAFSNLSELDHTTAVRSGKKNAKCYP
jgi:hypothetical protein